MAKKKARAIVPTSQKVTSRKHARRLTTSYHDITHRLASSVSDAERERCRSELEEMGGVKAYQQASALNTALNSTSRWVARELRGGSPTKGAPLPRVLEVGAINTQLLDSPGLRVRAIDLHALEPRIEQVDFFALPHGGELDVSTGVAVAYDAVVCSMVLNCVPGERRRFEMLVRLRAQLKSGGRAFVTVPRSCLDHSFTLSEASFRDALAAVGLPHTEAASTPDSAKIAFFDCVAGLPDAKAARRFQRARHEARAESRAAQRGAAKAARGVPRAKSAGAAFDVDVGGYLGFGVRVERSYVLPASRTSREQTLCQTEFLQQVETDGIGATAAAAEVGPVHDMAAACTLIDTPEIAGTSAWLDAFEAEASCHDDARLDYAAWRWYGGKVWHGPDDPRETPGWIFCGDSRGAPLGSAQERSGWQWGARGWAQAEPLAPAASAASPSDRAPSPIRKPTKKKKRRTEG